MVSRVPEVFVTLTVLSLTLLTGCSVIQGFLGDGGVEAVAQADQLLIDGDVQGSIDAYEMALVDNPENVDAAIGVAYGAWLQGDYARVDSVLATAEPFAPERLGELQLRRAMALIASGSVDEGLELAQSSGEPAGAVMAAEYLLADGEREGAMPLLEGARSATGGVGDAASGYLSLLNDEDPSVQGLAENYALWAIGERGVAVASVEDVVLSMPDEGERKAEELLLWAGRAASERELLVASNLLEAVTFPPPGQAWRVRATRAILDCAEGAEDEYAACKAGFTELDGLAPADGLIHARATAASLIDDPQVAVEILGTYKSVPGSMVAYQAGETGAAKGLVPAGMVAEFLAER
ncbi:MAG: tetratricopeptide (TPR) repeat protein [Cognaticolwellia sp.]